MSAGKMTAPDWERFWSLSSEIAEVQKRGAPALGETIHRGRNVYVCTEIRANGRVVLTSIPEGMTATDLGRKFNAARVEDW